MANISELSRWSQMSSMERMEKSCHFQYNLWLHGTAVSVQKSVVSLKQSDYENRFKSKPNLACTKFQYYRSISHIDKRFNGLFFIASVENTWGAQIWNLPDDWMPDLCFITTLSRRQSNCRTRIEESHRKHVFNCGAFVSSFHFYQITRSSSWTCTKINV